MSNAELLQAVTDGLARYDIAIRPSSPVYARIWNSTSLRETNFVFVLNVKIVRKPAFIQWWDHLDALDSDESRAEAVDDTLEIMDEDLQNTLPKAPGAR